MPKATGASNHSNLILTNRCKNGFRVFFCIDEGIGCTELKRKVGIRVTDKGESVGFRNRDGLLIKKVNPWRIEMTIFDRIKEPQVLQKKPIQGTWIREIGMGSDNQIVRTAQVR